MNNKIYSAEVMFEANISVKGTGYLVIYGKHVNGYFCCIPNWEIGCEMAEPSDTFYNADQLRSVGIGSEAAKGIAEAISILAESR